MHYPHFYRLSAFVTTSVFVAGLAAFANAPALAQDAWPSRPVTWVIATSPGGGVDFESRLYAQKLTDAFGKPFVLDYKPGAGSTFRFTIVCNPGADIASENIVAKPISAEFRPLRILVAEDNVVNQTIIAAYLLRAGHAIEMVENGALALKQVEMESYVRTAVTN